MTLRSRSRLIEGSTSQVSTWISADDWSLGSLPDFDKILDFTSAGGEASVSVDVTDDLEYKIITRNTDNTDGILLYLNAINTGTKYGRQYIRNNAGTITAARSTLDYSAGPKLSEGTSTLLAPSGFLRTYFTESTTYTSGTTMSDMFVQGYSLNDTTALTSMTFYMSASTFTAGTRIIVYRRRQN